MTHEHTSEGTHADETGTQRQSNPPTTAATQSPVDELVAGMIRTLEKIQHDPLLHYRLSQRGF